jgi:hypothetical protein
MFYFIFDAHDFHDDEDHVAMLWVMTPRRDVVGYRSFGGLCCILPNPVRGGSVALISSLNIHLCHSVHHKTHGLFQNRTRISAVRNQRITNSLSCSTHFVVELTN